MIRTARDGEQPRLHEIAVAGGAAVTPRYLATLEALGAELLVAELDGAAAAFGAVIDADGITMLTDLFVDPAARGLGLGSALVDALFVGAERRMTFSSKHPAAWAAYRRAGMEPRWRLLYLDGMWVGSGLPFEPGEWRHGRRELVAHYAATGARVGEDLVLDGTHVARVCSADPISVLQRSLASGPVSLCAPEHSPVGAWALAHDFSVSDFDTFFASPGVTLADDLHVLDPGLA
jgi:GNAT superfamily N-acetyltransferase